MKIFMDDLRPTPPGYLRVYSVEGAINTILQYEQSRDYNIRDYIFKYIDLETFNHRAEIWNIEEISCDNDLGEGECEGYKLLDWLEATGRNYPIRIHTDNAVARAHMRLIAERNHWEVIY